MFLTAEQIRFNKCCNEAMVGYASAMTAASGIVGNQIFSFWADAMGPGARQTPTKASRSVPRRSTLSNGPAAEYGKRRLRARSVAARAASGGGIGADFNWFLNPWVGAAGLPENFQGNPFAALGGLGGPPGFMPGGVGPSDMMGAWLDMDWSRSPRSWPMAYWMMASGMPREVARPMAEANLAMFDAFNAAGDIARRGPFYLGAAPAGNTGSLGRGPVTPDFFGAAGVSRRPEDRRGTVDAFGFAYAMPNMFFKS